LVIYLAVPAVASEPAQVQAGTGRPYFAELPDGLRAVRSNGLILSIIAVEQVEDLVDVQRDATAARFASAEAIRWIEWGMRSYQAFALGLALLLLAAAVVRVAWVPRPIGYLMGLSGLVWLAQGWVVGIEGFSPTMSNAIVLAEVLDGVWMIWLVVVAWRMRDAAPGRLADEGGARPEAIYTSAH
jgi:hypothetical protein